MNTTHSTVRILIAVTALCALGLPAHAKDAEPARATVTFETPEKFTDLKDSVTGTDKGREYYLKLIRNRVAEVAGQSLPAGQQLEMTFTDIDLAGDYLPAMASGHDIRVMKDVYMPRMAFTFKITDADGAVVKEGTETIRDLNYLSTVGIVGRNDALFYDLAMLSDWLRKNLK